jgi:YbbR domain-containing protein
MLDRILRNWPLKLLALGLAFAVWVAITGENRILVDYKVPVAVVLPPDRLLTKPPPTTVSVQLRGPEPILRGIDSTDLSLRLDLRDAGVGDRSVRFSSADVKGVPRGIDIMRFEPDHLAVSVAERTRRTIPVAPSFTDKPPRGYALYGAQAFPEALEVDGPGSEVGALARLRTDPISLGQRTAPFTVRVGAVSDSANVRVVDPRPVEVHAVVDVAPVESRFDPVPRIPKFFGPQNCQSLVSVLSNVRTGPTETRSISRIRDRHEPLNN